MADPAPVVAEFVRDELTTKVDGEQVVYRQEVDFAPTPKVTADARGVFVSGPFEKIDSLDKLHLFESVLNAAWTDHQALKIKR